MLERGSLAAAQSLSPAGETARLLVVSQSAEIQDGLRTILSRYGWMLLVARTCREALNLLNNGIVPVIISEESLPDGDWRLLLGALPSLSPRTRLIVYSHQPDDELWAEVLNLGGYDVLLSPLHAEEVIVVCYLAWQSSTWAH